jgi:signal transduction histidine kinase/ABC-type amino acid transport substrate-binding protein/DNA-binding response OmpR family regulator
MLFPCFALNGSTKEPEVPLTPLFSKYTGIPGITNEEIKAVEALRSKYTEFTFGIERSAGIFSGDDGSPAGFSVDVCRWLSGLFDIPFKPNRLQWNQLIADFDSQKIDFTGDLTPTPERLKKYQMTTVPIASRVVKLMRLTSSDDIEEIAETRKIRYGFIKDTITFDKVEKSLDSHSEIIFAGNYGEAYKLLKNGDIDGLVDEETGEGGLELYDDIFPDRLLPLVVTPAALAANNPELAPVISIVQKALEHGETRYLHYLYQQRLARYHQYRFLRSLSEEERTYLDAHGKDGIPIPIGMEFDNYPVAFYNVRESRFQGAAVDFLDQTAELTGLRFSVNHPAKTSWNDLFHMLESGEIALVTDLIQTPQRQDKFIWNDIPVMINDYALISRTESPNFALSDVFHLTVGATKGTAYAERFRQWFPEHTKYIEYDSGETAFDELKRGKIDLVMGTQFQLLTMTYFDEKPYFKANIMFRKRFGHYCGFNKNETLLCSIINKAAKHIDMELISSRWSSRVFDYNGALARERMPYLIGLLILFFCVIVLLTVTAVKSRRSEYRLETAVAERTEELKQQTRIAEAQSQKAEDASRTKSIFLAKMSHEIRTPMNAVIGMCELILRENVPPKAAEYISKIRQAGHHLLAIINDILDFSKVESGNLQIHTAEYETASLFNDVLSIIQIQLSEKPVALVTSIDPNIPAVMIGDEVHIRKILLNLLSNAVKYTHTGTITFAAQAAITSHDTLILRFAVMDTGIGIKEDDLPQLFRSFIRFDTADTNNRGIEGTGLGMVIVKQLCLAMGGDVSVTSEYGKGSTFTAVIEQKFTDSKPVGEINLDAVIDGEQYAVFTAENFHVLLVDDVESNLQVAEGLLSQYGVNTVSCLSGFDALQILKNRTFDLVLMDHMMPKMDGVETLKRIREEPDERLKSLPVIALTANAVVGMKEFFMDNGFNDFLSKPIEMRRLDELMRRWVPKEKRLHKSALLNPDTASADAQQTEPSGHPVTADDVEYLNIEGVNIAEGLARVQGLRQVYLKMLTAFCRDMDNQIPYFERVPDEEEMSEFTVHAHGVKGAAASIGARRLSATGALLQSAGENSDKETIAKNIEQFRNDIIAVTKNIRGAIRQ